MTDNPRCNIYKCYNEADYYFHWFRFYIEDEITDNEKEEKEGFVCLKHFGNFLDALTNLNIPFWFYELEKRERVLFT